MLNQPGNRLPPSEVALPWLRIVVVLAALCAVSEARAQLLFSRSWIDPNGGSYNDPNNWDSGIPDSNTELANFDLDATYTVDFPQGAFTSSAAVRDGNVTWDLDTGGGPTAYLLNSLSVRPSAFDGRDPHLTVRDGTVLSKSVLVSDGGRLTQTGATINFDTGAATVSGAGSRWTQTNGFFRVGEFGSGVLLIEDGGLVENVDGVAVGRFSGAEGTATVTGDDSTLVANAGLTIGQEGRGTLVIEDGGTVTASQSFNDASRIGFADGAVGGVTVTGAGSTWNNDGRTLYVGEGGNGGLVVEKGGSVLARLGSIGQDLGSRGTATVRGTGSTWTCRAVFVGIHGEGALTIEDGGRVVSTNSEPNTFGGIIGSENGLGMVTVNGDGSAWEGSTELDVGALGEGILNIESGGRVSSGNAFVGGAFGGSSDADGTINVTGRDLTSGVGSNWSVEGKLSIGGDAVFGGGNQGKGLVFVQAGTTVDVSDDTVLFPDGSLRLLGGTLATTAIRFEEGGEFLWRAGLANVAGTLHVDIFAGDLTVPDTGALAPGRPDTGTPEAPGSTTILGDYTQQADGVLAIELGGLATATQHDFVNVTGTATLGGELQLSLIDGFVPSPTDEITIFNASNLLNFFTNAGSGQRVDTIDGLGSFVVHYGPTSTFDEDQIVLTDFLFSGQPGDFDLDGSVDGDDFLKWQRGESPNPLSQAELADWQSNYGAEPAPISGGTIVPEPSAGSSLLTALACAFFASTKRSPRRPGTPRLSRGGD